MSLVGSRVGLYDVVAAIGAGGMGEVYRAHDARLQRDVALKVLPASFVSDPERLARFEREARVLASLNHPNIAAIFGLTDPAREGHHAPVLVLELVEGETLQDVIARGPLPADEAIAIALQVAEALEAAHDKGIVHRDLKPGNVKITPEGKVKVLDFGLAKALESQDAQAPADPAVSPTFTSPATELGMILGTAAYMSPEQARGKAVDRRGDVWAFGALLYEMLTGSRAFPGETISDTLAAVLKSEPDWRKLPAATPPPLRQLLARCLERDPRQRLQAIGEARIALAAPAKGEIVSPDRRGGRIAATVALALVVTAAAFGAGWWLKPTARAAPQERRFDLATDDLQVGLESAPKLSPDGRRIVYRAGGRLWVRSFDGFAARPLAVPADAVYPFWSPDSRQVAFVRDRKLWRVALDGGEATLIGGVPADMGGSAGGVWTATDDLVLAGSDAVGLYAIPHTGGTGREILPLDPAKETDFHEITALPDNRGLIFTTHRRAGPDAIVLFADGTRRTVFELPGETLRAPAYADPGYLLFTRETTSPGIWAVRFSLDTLETAGSPFLVAAGATWPSAGQNGTLAFVRASDQPSQLVWVDRSGNVLPSAELPGQLGGTDWDWSTFSLSPDRQRAVLGLRQGSAETDIWSYDLVRGNLARLPVGADMVINPTWSADGRRIFFAAFLGQRTWNIYAVSATETGRPERLLAASNLQQWPCSVSPDGEWILYAQGQVSSTDLWLAALDGSSPPAMLFSTPFREIDAKFSPDGQWIAYTSNESGRAELYVRGFPIRDDRVKVSTGGATLPAWSPDGRELYYRTPSAVMAATMTPTPNGLRSAPPREVFAIPDSSFSQPFGVSSDGQRLLFARARGSDRLGVVLNWTPSPDDRR